MESKIVITSDSTTDLGTALKERYHIDTLPLGIVLGDQLYNDGVDITPFDIYEHHAKTGELPKTNATNIDDAALFFKKYVDAGNTVIHFCLSSEMSSNYNNARLAAEEVGNVFVIDSRNLSTGGGLLVIEAAEMAKQGLSAEEIVEKINGLIPCVDTSFVIDSLEYLYKGGRCSALAMFGANLMKLKPCIQVKDGVMGVAKKYRGKFPVVLEQYVREQLSDLDDIKLDRIFVTHAGCDLDMVQDIVNLVKEIAPFKEVFVTTASCTISSHCGQNSLGILFIRKSQI